MKSETVYTISNNFKKKAFKMQWCVQMTLKLRVLAKSNPFQTSCSIKLGWHKHIKSCLLKFEFSEFVLASNRLIDKNPNTRILC